MGTAIKHQKKLIEAYKKKLSRASIGEVLERHVRASYVERQKTKQVASWSLSSLHHLRFVS